MNKIKEKLKNNLIPFLIGIIGCILLAASYPNGNFNNLNVINTFGIGTVGVNSNSITVGNIMLSRSLTPAWQHYWTWENRTNESLWNPKADGFSVLTINGAQLTNNLILTNGAIYYTKQTNTDALYFIQTNTTAIMRCESIVRWSTNWANTASTAYQRFLNITVGTLPQDNGAGSISMQGDSLHFSFNCGTGPQLVYWTNAVSGTYTEVGSGLRQIGGPFVYRPVDGELMRVGWSRNDTNSVLVFCGPQTFELRLQRLATNFFNTTTGGKYIWWEIIGNDTSNQYGQAGVRSFAFSGDQIVFTPNWINPNYSNVLANTLTVQGAAGATNNLLNVLDQSGIPRAQITTNGNAILVRVVTTNVYLRPISSPDFIDTSLTNLLFSWSSNDQSVWWSTWGANGVLTNIAHLP